MPNATAARVADIIAAAGIHVIDVTHPAPGAVRVTVTPGRARDAVAALFRADLDAARSGDAAVLVTLPEEDDAPPPAALALTCGAVHLLVGPPSGPACGAVEPDGCASSANTAHVTCPVCLDLIAEGREEIAADDAAGRAMLAPELADACEGCNAETGEDCRPHCTGEAAHLDDTAGSCDPAAAAAAELALARDVVRGELARIRTALAEIAEHAGHLPEGRAAAAAWHALPVALFAS